MTGSVIEPVNPALTPHCSLWSSYTSCHLKHESRSRNQLTASHTHTLSSPPTSTSEPYRYYTINKKYHSI